MHDDAPTGPAGSDASRAEREDRAASKLPKQRTQREERRESYSRTQDDARVIEGEGKAFEMGAAAMRQGTAAAMSAVEASSSQLVKAYEIIGSQSAEIQRLNAELGEYKRGEKKKKGKNKAAKLQAEVDRYRIEQYADVARKLGPTVLPLVIEELMPALRPLLRRGGDLADKLLAAAVGGDEETDEGDLPALPSGANATPKAAAGRLVRKLLGQVEGLEDEGKEVLGLLQALAGEDDWPLVQEWLIVQTVAPAPANGAPAEH